jgi:hypothetical protein
VNIGMAPETIGWLAMVGSCIVLVIAPDGPT